MKDGSRLRDLEALAKEYMADGFRPYFQPEGSKAYRGFTTEDLQTFRRRVPARGREVLGWQDPGFRSVWVYVAEQAILTYCEGDVDLVQDSSDESFNRRIRSEHLFYTGHALPHGEPGEDVLQVLLEGACGGGAG